MCSCTTYSNEDRAARVEQFLLDEAISIGVVATVKLYTSKNPNRWGKQLAPWFTPVCRESRRAYIAIRRQQGANNHSTKEAFMKYKEVCKQATKDFLEELPGILKYQPKRFWGMLKKPSTGSTHVPNPEEFAAYNKALYWDPSAPPTTSPPLHDPQAQSIMAEELGLVLQSHFKANKSSGWSTMPLQLLKYIREDDTPILADFLTDTAITREPPQAWKDTKVVPLYKGKGTPSDYNNYRSIAVSHPFAKLLMSVVNQRLTSLGVELQVHAPTQAGFRAHYTTTEQALILQQLIQYANVTKSQLGIVFVDLQKAYDTVCRVKLWDTLIDTLGIPEDLVSIIQRMYAGAQGIVGDSRDTGHAFPANKGVKQGDGASPELFTMYFDRVHPHVVEYCKEHFGEGSREQHLFTIACLQLFMLSFADDVALVGASPEMLQLTFTAFRDFC